MIDSQKTIVTRYARAATIQIPIFIKIRIETYTKNRTNRYF